MIEELKLKELKEALETKKIMIDRIKIVEHNEMFDDSVLILDLGGVRGIIPREEVSIVEQKFSLVKFAGAKIKFMITEIDEENDLVICSRKEVEKLNIESFLNEVKETPDKIYKAKITKFLPYGAYCNIKGVNVLLTNKDFSDDFVTIEEAFKNETDRTIEVRFGKESANKRIYVKAAKKHVRNTIMSIDNFKPNQIVEGVVKSIKPFGCFVNIAPGLDGLCSIPENYPIEVGSKVAFKIKQVNKGDEVVEREDEILIEGKEVTKRRGIRGSIIRPINDFEEDFL